LIQKYEKSLGLGLENYGGLGLDNKVLFTSLQNSVGPCYGPPRCVVRRRRGRSMLRCRWSGAVPTPYCSSPWRSIFTYNIQHQSSVC